MLFRLVLWLLALRLRWLGKRHPEVQKRLQNQQVVMQWRTVKGKPARWFYFTPAGVTSKAGLHPKAQTSINFKDAGTAMDVLKRASKNQMAFMEAMQQGDVRIEERHNKRAAAITIRVPPAVPANQPMVSTPATDQAPKTLAKAAIFAGVDEKRRAAAGGIASKEVISNTPTVRKAPAIRIA